MGRNFGKSWVQPGEKCPVPALKIRLYPIHNRAKVTVVDVNMIRVQRYKLRRTYRELALEYSLSISAIASICRGKSWT